MVRYRKFNGEAKFGTVYLQFLAEEERDATVRDQPRRWRLFR